MPASSDMCRCKINLEFVVAPLLSVYVVFLLSILFSEAAAAAETSGIAIVNKQTWPGGGVALTLRVHPYDVLASGKSSPVELNWLRNSTRINASTASTSLPPGHTIVVLIPPPVRNREAQGFLAEAASAFIKDRSKQEKISVYRWGAELDQLRDFTNNTDYLLEAVTSLDVTDPPDTYTDVDSVLTYVAGEVVRVGGPSHQGMRSVVFIGAPPPSAPTVSGFSALVQWLVVGPVDKDLIKSVQQDQLFEVMSYKDLVETARQVSRRIDDFADEGHLRIALCSAGEGGRARVSIDNAESTFLIPAHTPGKRTGRCSIPAMLAGVRSYPDTMAFKFTEAQRKTYDYFTSTEHRGIFELSVQFDDSRPPVPATAHHRGRGSIACNRKSYTLSLEVNTPEFLMPNSTANDFYVLSLCLDDRYVHQYTILQIWQQLGLFPFEFRLIELTIDGESRGMYLLIEKVREAYQLDHSRVGSILRRDTPDAATADVKYSSTTDVLAAADYNSLLQRFNSIEGPELTAKLSTYIDLEQYWLMLAAASVLQNGDYVDEVWMFSSEESRPNGTLGGRYRFAAWDPEDVFSRCHSKRLEFIDPHGLSYCAETALDHTILSDPLAYEGFADALQELVEEKLTHGIFKAALDNTRTHVLHYLMRPEISQAMSELIESNPAARDPAVAAGEVNARLAELEVEFVRRQELLRERIEEYRDSTP
ncbi:CotH kinase family protein [Gammaproteobacteria bacterium]|nr:CotH kinase family protein [Gammaproteobacteria bacterium]